VEIDMIVLIFKDLISTALYIVLPLLVIGTIVAIGVGILQSMTQIQEQTLSFTPKLIISGLILFFASSAMFAEIVQTVRDVISATPEMFL